MNAWHWIAIGSHAMLLAAFVVVFLSHRWTARLLLLQLDTSRAGYLQALNLLVEADMIDLKISQLARRLRDAEARFGDEPSTDPRVREVCEELDAIACAMEDL